MYAWHQIVGVLLGVSLRCLELDSVIAVDTRLELQYAELQTWSCLHGIARVCNLMLRWMLLCLVLRPHKHTMVLVCVSQVVLQIVLHLVRDTVQSLKGHIKCVAYTTAVVHTVWPQEQHSILKYGLRSC